MEQWLTQVAPFLSDNLIFTPNTLAQYWDGLVNTVQLVFISLVVGLFLAVPLAVGRASRRVWLNVPIWLFTYVFRGTPLLIQLHGIDQAIPVLGQRVRREDQVIA